MSSELSGVHRGNFIMFPTMIFDSNTQLLQVAEIGACEWGGVLRYFFILYV